MFAVSIAVAVLSVVILCGVAVPLEITRAQATLLLFAASFVAVVAVLLCTIFYRVTDTHLRLQIAFLDILGGRIRIENILNIVYKSDTADKKNALRMYISYIWKGGDPVIAQIAIKPKHFDKLKNTLIAQNPNIVFWDERKTDGK